MIFTTRVRSDAGVPLEDVTEDPAFQALLKGKNILYVLSTRLDGPNVCKFGVAHDRARRGWNISRLRWYIKHHGLNRKDTTNGSDKHHDLHHGDTKDVCHGVRLHLLCTTKATDNAYNKTTLVRVEAALKAFYAKTSASMKSVGRGDERVRVPPSSVIAKVLELKTRLPHAVSPAHRRAVLPRGAKAPTSNSRRASLAPRKSAQTNLEPPKKKKVPKKTAKTKKWVVEAIVGKRPWEVAVKWAGFKTPTWENQALVRKDLGAKAMKKLMDDFESRKPKKRRVQEA
jgi:hypothetical protein